jgi:citrate lyase subunit beta/citryl-CoA lyase
MNRFRSLLFIPGNKESMLDKALNLRPDIFIPDIEDSVPEDQKIIARDLIQKKINDFAQTNIPIMPRLNALSTIYIEKEISELTSEKIYGFTIGKIKMANDIKQLDELLSRAENNQSISPGKIKVIPWLESAEGVLNAREIASSSDRIVALAFGGEDFAQDMGIERTQNELNLEYPRQSVALAARAAGIYAIDTPYFNYKDNEGLTTNINYVKNIGFKGKFAIHPMQIDIINKHFSPSQEEINHAREVVKTFDTAMQEGRGSTSLNGKVIDMPVYKRAKDILNLDN